MPRSVAEILAHRRQLAAKPRRAGAWLSLLLHAGFVTAVLVTPLMTEADQKPPRFVSVALVSAEALGVSDPEPARQEPQRTQPPSPEPTPPPAQSQPKLPTPDPAILLAMQVIFGIDPLNGFESAHLQPPVAFSQVYIFSGWCA